MNAKFNVYEYDGFEGQFISVLMNHQEIGDIATKVLNGETSLGLGGVSEGQFFYRIDQLEGKTRTAFAVKVISLLSLKGNSDLLARPVNFRGEIEIPLSSIYEIERTVGNLEYVKSVLEDAKNNSNSLFANVIEDSSNYIKDDEPIFKYVNLLGEKFRLVEINNRRQNEVLNHNEYGNLSYKEAKELEQEGSWV